MKSGISSCRRPLVVALAVGLFVMGTSAFGQEIRWMPVRTNNFGSTPGTVGVPATGVTFNDTLGCWEYKAVGGNFEMRISKSEANFKLEGSKTTNRPVCTKLSAPSLKQGTVPPDASRPLGCWTRPSRVSRRGVQSP